MGLVAVETSWLRRRAKVLSHGRPAIAECQLIWLAGGIGRLVVAELGLATI
jgi:hypothetical protein